MAQNIIVSWLVGARFIELKTVQTLDELDVNKPCIDIEDEGYNVEWSQELKVYSSFDEYLRAWVLIHALHRRLGFPGDTPGVVFNLSVGYNLEGILCMPEEGADTSRMWLKVNEEKRLEQVVKQTRKLEDVLEEMDERASRIRELTARRGSFRSLPMQRAPLSISVPVTAPFRGATRNWLK